MSTKYSPVAFHFKVEFTDITDSDKEISFQSVSGLTVELDTEELAEGGENRFKHTLPLRSKYPNLVLKRGLLPNSEIINWCRNALENFVFEPKDLVVSLLNENHEPLMTWNVAHAIPVKWSVADFNAEENNIAIETLELKYNYFTSIISNGN